MGAKGIVGLVLAVLAALMALTVACVAHIKRPADGDGEGMGCFIWVVIAVIGVAGLKLLGDEFHVKLWN
jgi:hypothetical protein